MKVAALQDFDQQDVVGLSVPVGAGQPLRFHPHGGLAEVKRRAQQLIDILCVAVNSGNCSVVLYANSDHATVRVGKCNQVNGKGFRVNPCALAVKERRFHRTTYLFNRHFAAHARTPSS